MRINVKDARHTDAHDVDENETTITRRGGDCGDSINAGIAQQGAYNPPNTAIPSVASSNMKNSQIIRIGIMSTKTW